MRSNVTPRPFDRVLSVGSASTDPGLRPRPSSAYPASADVSSSAGIGLGWTVVIMGGASLGLLGANGALIAAVLHNLGTLLVMANAGRLLKFQEDHTNEPGQWRLM